MFMAIHFYIYLWNAFVYTHTYITYIHVYTYIYIYVYIYINIYTYVSIYIHLYVIYEHRVIFSSTIKMANYTPTCVMVRITGQNVKHQWYVVYVYMHLHIPINYMYRNIYKYMCSYLCNSENDGAKCETLMVCY
jgi:hypothetical protein